MTRADSRSRTSSGRSSESKYGRELFVTSLTGEYVRVYPMPVWLEKEEKLGQMPSTHPSRLRFLDRVNFFGQVAEIDAQGRVLIPARLRETATMSGDVDVLGLYNYLDVWNHDRVRHQAAARSLHRRRRAGAVGVRHLMTATSP